MGFPTLTDQTPPKSALNISGTTVIKTGPGYVFSASAGAATISVYDGSVAGDAAAANLIATIPIATTVQLNYPLSKGLVVAGTGPGSVSYS